MVEKVSAECGRFPNFSNKGFAMFSTFSVECQWLPTFGSKKHTLKQCQGLSFLYCQMFCLFCWMSWKHLILCVGGQVSNPSLHQQKKLSCFLESFFFFDHWYKFVSKLDFLVQSCCFPYSRKCFCWRRFRVARLLAYRKLHLCDVTRDCLPAFSGFEFFSIDEKSSKVIDVFCKRLLLFLWTSMVFWQNRFFQ